MASPFQIVSDTGKRTQPFFGTVTPYGQVRAALDASPLFYEDFSSGTIDTTVKWLTQTVGTGIAATNAVGATVLNGGTTANSISLLQTRPAFQPQEPGFVNLSTRVNVQSPIPAANYLAWGLFTTPVTPTFAAPISNGALFEVGSTGKMAAVTYASGGRLLIQDLSASTGNGSQPTDANAHKYYIYFTGAECYFAIDSPDNVVASFLSGASGPDVNTLPISYLVVSNAGSAATMQVNATILGNTTGGNITQCDPMFPFRQQQIGANGDAVTSLFATAGNNWNASSGITPLAVATSTLAKAAAGAGKRIYVTGIQAYNNSATVNTTFSILDGASVIYTGFLPATTAALPVVDLTAVFQSPLQGTANTALNVQCGTTGASVFWNLQGFIGA